MANLEKQSADEPRVADLRGDIAVKRDDLVSATAAYKRAFEQQPTTIRVLKLAEVQKAFGRRKLSGHRGNVAWSTPGRCVGLAPFSQRRYQGKTLPGSKRELREGCRACAGQCSGTQQSCLAAVARGRRAGSIAPCRARAGIGARRRDCAGHSRSGVLEAGEHQPRVGVAERSCRRTPRTTPRCNTTTHRFWRRRGTPKEALDVLTRALSNGADFSERAEAEALLKELGG